MTTETYDLTDPTRPTIVKDPQAVLDYSWDWSAWLAGIGDTYASHTIFQETGGPTTVGSAQTAGIISAFISGGVPDAKHRVTCRIVTVGGRTDDRSIFLKIKDR